MAASSFGARSIRMPKASSTRGNGIADLAEGAGHHGVHDGAHGARHPPPLTGGDDDGEGDEQQAEPVPAVLGLEVAAGVTDLAGDGTGGVGQAHPGALDGPQRQRQAHRSGCGRVPCGAVTQVAGSPAGYVELRPRAEEDVRVAMVAG